MTRTTLVDEPAIVVGTVEVKPTSPEVLVTVCRSALDTGDSTTTMLVGTPLIVVATVVVRVTLPVEMVVV